MKDLSPDLADSIIVLALQLSSGFGESNLESAIVSKQWLEQYRRDFEVISLFE